MSVVLTIVGGWLVLTAVALIGMSFMGRAARTSDEASADDAARVHAWQDGVALGVVAPHPLREIDVAVCVPCAAKVAGVTAGDPCPACGTAVTQTPRILAPIGERRAPGTTARRAI